MAIVSIVDGSEIRAQLAALIEADGVSYAALSRMLRRNDAYLQQYLRRGTPRDLAERDRALLAAYFRVDAAELGGGAAPSMATIRWLQVEASAGPGALSDDDAAGDALLLDPRLIEALRLDPDHAAMMRARGDSMAPTIADGDQIVVDERDRRVTAKPAIFVLRREGALLVKRVSRAVGTYIIASDNPAYPPTEASEVGVIGRVVWLSRALR